MERMTVNGSTSEVVEDRFYGGKAKKLKRRQVIYVINKKIIINRTNQTRRKQWMTNVVSGQQNGD